MALELGFIFEGSGFSFEGVGFSCDVAYSTESLGELLYILATHSKGGTYWGGSIRGGVGEPTT